MTVPGIGPITALAFRSAVDEPLPALQVCRRLFRADTAPLCLGISKCGDAMVRSYLFEAAGVLLTRVGHWCKLKAWGHRLWKRIGFKKAKIAVARKLAVILHRMWRDGTDFIWSTKEAAA
jgi:transposase